MVVFSKAINSLNSRSTAKVELTFSSSDNIANRTIRFQRNCIRSFKGRVMGGYVGIVEVIF